MQSGKTVSTENGLEMEFLDGTKAYKWPGCLVSIWNAGNREADWDLRLEATLRPLNKWVNFFDSVVTSVVRFGFFFGQHERYMSEVRKLDVHCNKIFRQFAQRAWNKCN